MLRTLFTPPRILCGTKGIKAFGFGRWGDDVTEADTAPYKIIEFAGGMFLVATGDEKDGDDLNETVSCMMKWIEDSDIFEYGDFPKSGMCHMPNGGGAIDKALGIAQQEIFLPIKFIEKK